MNLPLAVLSFASVILPTDGFLDPGAGPLWLRTSFLLLGFFIRCSKY